jgi:TonB family protein
VGPGRGSGAGPGGGGGVSLEGAGAIRGAITAPALLWKVEPEYSEEARKARLQGTVLLRVEINTRGQVQNVEVARGLGLGLDERAVEAVRRWRFRSGTAGGKPVVMTAVVEMRFQLL